MERFLVETKYVLHKSFASCIDTTTQFRHIMPRWHFNHVQIKQSMRKMQYGPSLSRTLV